MTGPQIEHAIIQQVAVRPRLPQMVVRIDDRQVRLQHRLGQLRQPVRPDTGSERFALDALAGHGNVPRLLASIQPRRSPADNRLATRGLSRPGLPRLGCAAQRVQ